MKHNNRSNKYWPSAANCIININECTKATITNRKQQQLCSSSCDHLLNINCCCFINSPMMRPFTIKPDPCNTNIAHNTRLSSFTHRNDDNITGHIRQFIVCKKKNITISQSQGRNLLIFTSLLILLIIEFASYLPSSNNLISTTTVSYNSHHNLPSCIMAEAIKLTDNFDKYHHDRYRRHHHHHHQQPQQHPRYHFEKDIEQSSINNNDKLKETDDENYFNTDHEDLSKLPSKFYDEDTDDDNDDDLTSEINSVNNNNSSSHDVDSSNNNNNNVIEKSDNTSPVVVISGVNSYVSASPISIENIYNHKNQYTQHHHIRPPHTFAKSITKSSSEASMNNDITNSTEAIVDSTIQPERSLNSDNDEYLFSNRHSIVSQQNKRSNVHDELLEKNMRISQVSKID